ncbi:hypothetical protein ACJIZ3_002741 [Penstemon smallii]|uniref:Uncharacterized protein n=1 Tax=Penstemon smallii TaxID=265156 RepID=A0ABD3UA32_9LAMI
MSRCLPYPPPGYSLSRSSNEALIESIKLQKEREKSKEQRKEKKREKKEKKKEKHEKTKEKKDKTTKKLDTLNTQVVKKVCEDTKVNFLLKTRETETKQLERSNLTSEHEEPIPLDGPSTSFDSTENSNKRKRHPSPPVVDCSRRHGKIIRIRLTSKKQNESNTPAVEHCSTSGRSDFPARKEDANIGQPMALKIERERICAPQPVVAIAPCKTKNPSIVNAVMTPMQRAELEYKNLIVDWTPPQLQDTFLDQDSDWLFSSKKPDVCAEKRQKCGDDRISCSSSSALYPRAQYLNEVDIYALPFTVPF